MDSIQIPYYAHPDELPSELPNKDAIKSSTEILCEQSARRPRRRLEYDFRQRRTPLLVPGVYALFKDAETGENYIIMERIQGDRLDSIWTSLDYTQKRAIALQIKTNLTELHKLRSPDSYCSLGCKPLRDHIFYTGYEDASLGLEGPFKTETELNDALLKKYLSSGYLPPGKADYYRRAFPSVFTGHPRTFTHGDLQRKNILVNTKDYSITILDWEFAGWYPSYWEYSRAIFACGRFDDDWSE